MVHTIKYHYDEIIAYFVNGSDYVSSELFNAKLNP